MNRNEFIESLPIDIGGILKIAMLEDDKISITTRSMLDMEETHESEITPTTIENCINLIENSENVLYFKGILEETYPDEIRIRYGVNGCYVEEGQLRTPNTPVRFHVRILNTNQFVVDVKLRTQVDGFTFNVFKNMDDRMKACVMSSLKRTLPWIVDTADYSNIIQIPNVYDNTLQMIQDEMESFNLLDNRCYVYTKHFNGVYVDMIHIISGGLFDVILTSPAINTVVVDIYDRDTGRLFTKPRKFVRMKRNVPMHDAHNYIYTAYSNTNNLRKYSVPTKEICDVLKDVFKLGDDTEITKANVRIRGAGLDKYGVHQVFVRGITLNQYEGQTCVMSRLINTCNIVIYLKSKDPEDQFSYGIGFEYFRDLNMYFAFEYGDRSNTYCTDIQIDKIKRRMLKKLNKYTSNKKENCCLCINC